jgi:thiamine pyrophosphate-dependent acetolactate synthase large subunit-like protein
MSQTQMSQTYMTATIDRREFVARLLAACPQSLVVTGLGSPAYDVFAAGDRPENFYLWGAMGGAAVIALGLALAQPERSVLVVTGDGEQLMGLGGLATIGAQQPANLSIVVLDNGHFGETGMQRSHTSLGTSLAAVARGCGIGNVAEIHEMSEVAALAERVNARQACQLAQVFVRAEDLPRMLPPRDGVHLKNRFRAALGFDPM